MFQCCNLAENAELRSFDVINQLQGNINASQQVLETYKNSIETQAQVEQQKITENRSSTLTKIQVIILIIFFRQIIKP